MKVSVTTVIVTVLVSLLILIVGSYLLNQFFGIDILTSIKERLGTSQASDNQPVVDATPLEVTLSSSELLTLDSSTSLVLISNKDLKLSENARLNLVYVEQNDSNKFYVLEVSNIGIGSAPLNFSVSDNSGEIKEFVVVLNRQDYPLPFGLTEVEDWEGSKYTIDGNNPLAKVSKESRLVDDYAPTDLIDLNKDKLLYTNSEGIRLRTEAVDYLALMLGDLKEETGKIVVIASGYRSIIDQFKQYVSWVSELGQEQADKVSARPGYSEHSLGMVVDFMSQDSGFSFTNEFDNTVAGKWLKDNASKYGYVQSYPEGKELITGYNYEAWHYRYIGVENALDLKESNLTLKEWLQTK